MKQLLWPSLIIPSLVWLAYLTASFTYAAYACHNKSILHILTFISVIVTSAGTWGGWKCYQYYEEHFKKGKRLLSLTAVLLNLLLLLTIIISEFANHLMEPCI